MNPSTSVPRDLLEAPFPPEAIRTRPGSYGSVLSYLEGHTVIGRLNDAFDGGWSFEIVSHQVLDEEVLVLGKFRADAAGIVKMAFGSSKVTRNERTGQPVSLGDDFKAAATDCLKKAATLLGVGLQLYGGNGSSGNGKNQGGSSTSRETVTSVTQSFGNPSTVTPVTPVTPSGERGENGRPNGNGRITNKQITAIFSIARQRNIPHVHVRALANEMFGKTVDYLSKFEGSQLIETLLNQ